MPDEAGRSALVERVRTRLRNVAFESLYGPLAWLYDRVSRTFFLRQWCIWQRASIPHLRGKRVLEVGMGTGNLQIDLRRAGFEPYGIDLSPQMLREARRKARKLKAAPYMMCRARAQALPFPDATFDSVVSTFPSDYIAERETLQELARVLRPEGRLVVVPGGWLYPRGARGKAMQGVARAVYGYTGEPESPADDADVLEQLARQGSGWHHWSALLSERMAEAGFRATLQVASNDKGACLVIVADK